jgi:hypothetical protein
VTLSCPHGKVQLERFDRLVLTLRTEDRYIMKPIQLIPGSHLPAMQT